MNTKLQNINFKIFTKIKLAEFPDISRIQTYVKINVFYSKVGILFKK